MDGTGDEFEEGGVVEGPDVVEGEGGREAELLDEGGHDFGVVFCGVRVSCVPGN